MASFQQQNQTPTDQDQRNRVRRHFPLLGSRAVYLMVIGPRQIRFFPVHAKAGTGSTSSSKQGNNLSLHALLPPPNDKCCKSGYLNMKHMGYRPEHETRKGRPTRTTVLRNRGLNVLPSILGSCGVKSWCFLVLGFGLWCLQLVPPYRYWTLEVS